MRQRKTRNWMRVLLDKRFAGCKISFPDYRVALRHMRHVTSRPNYNRFGGFDGVIWKVNSRPEGYYELLAEQRRVF